ncbi:MAG: hypothetical protein Q8R76_10255 [Candidatus Omnitrophota bacterium]|nr:hypothetical protein [Candidatus Omnitrophota bacterium]
MPENPMEKGVQPLDGLLAALKLKNTGLVEASSEQLTHRMVAKGRKGRRLTVNTQKKILKALNRAQAEKVFVLQDLFNYRGK